MGGDRCLYEINTQSDVLFYDESHYGGQVSSVALRAPAPYKQGAPLHSIFLFKVFNANRYLGKSANSKNRDWVSLLVYKEVAGEAGRRILAWGSDTKG